MIKYIVLLRGVNVGGHRKVSMAELKALLSKIGFTNVQTYIQSGNIILQSSLTNTSEIADKIKSSIVNHFGFEVHVLVRTRTHLLDNFESCPFSESKKEQSYFVILSHIPKAELLDKALEKTYDNEEFKIINDCLYFHSSVGYGRSKFNMNSFEKNLQVKATSRNHRTILKLLELSS